MVLGNSEVQSKQNFKAYMKWNISSAMMMTKKMITIIEC